MPGTGWPWRGLHRVAGVRGGWEENKGLHGRIRDKRDYLELAGTKKRPCRVGRAAGWVEVVLLDHEQFVRCELNRLDV